MRDNNTKYRLFSRRTLIIGGIKLLLLSAIASRYFHLQILKSDKYHTLSDKNRFKFNIVAPDRGKIFDRYSNEIATNTRHFRLVVDSMSIKNIDSLLAKLRTIAGPKFNIPKEEIQAKIAKRHTHDYLYIADDITWKENAKITESLHELPGVDIIISSHRHYKYGEATAHITGYIGLPTPDEIEKYSIPLSNQIKIGKSGIERFYDYELRGKTGYKKNEVDVHGGLIRNISQNLPISGNNIRLSVDAELQNFIDSIFKSRGFDGAAVVLDAQTGEVLALNVKPSFDPNQFVDGVKKQYWDSITQNATVYPLLNRAVSSAYPPGSTFKLVTALAGLRNNIPHTQTYHCSGVFNMGHRQVKCWKADGHGTINMHTAIAQSCNPYFFNLALAIGMDKLAKTAKDLGLGAKTNVELLGEASGIMPDPSWKKNRFKLAWYPGDTVNASIGQGYVLSTPIQLAQMTARIATGRIVKPSLTLVTDPYDFDSLDIDKSAFHHVRTGMFKCANSPEGLLFRQSLSVGDLTVCGKTGTAQVVDLKKKNLKRNFKHHSLFTSFAPYEDPKYVVSVVVEHGESGARSATPVAKEIYAFLYRNRIVSKQS
ncbi:MAG: penicillin-binding protein 2 [Alphaproteobacteria bacterium]|jgi:penicillin-binding protein 2|nr:penicillin-binding protein 2 [Candidatus Jidaibacter sp.]